MSKPLRTLAAPLLLALLVALAACGGEGDDGVAQDPISLPGDDSTDDSTDGSTDEVPAAPQQVATWSEGGHRDQTDWLRAHLSPQILEGEEAEAFVADLPESFAAEAADLLAVDLDDAALLVAGFHECGNAGEATVEGGVVRYRVRTVENITCVWAPIRVRVFKLPKGLRLEG